MGWGKKVVQGIEFDLTHLDDAVVDVVVASKGVDGAITNTTYRVLVSYGLHCFARESRPDDHGDFHIHDNGDFRCLCPIRTGLSKHLPRIVREAANDHAYFSQGTNMLLVEEIEDIAGPYAVFFNVRQSKQKHLDVVMFVASAYEKLALPERLPAVTFATLIAKASKGHVPFRPKRKKKWSKK